MISLRHRNEAQPEDELVDTSLENLIKRGAKADQILEETQLLNRRLHHRLERKGIEMHPSQFAALKAEVEQSDIRFTAALKDARAIRTILDEARNAEQAKVDREVALRDYDNSLQNLNHVHATRLEQEKQFQALRRALEFGAQRESELLLELHNKKIVLKNLGIAI